MKIYTKTGDKGSTSLFGGGPLPKNHVRIGAYGCVDELSSVLGCVVAELEKGALKERLEHLQKELFVLGAELATRNPNEKMQAGFLRLETVTRLEEWIDQMEGDLEPLKQFILPGGVKAAALLHVARTVCRRAERETVALAQIEPLRDVVIIYLNRLSDLLFVLARWVNRCAGRQDILWEGIL